MLLNGWLEDAPGALLLGKKERVKRTGIVLAG